MRIQDSYPLSPVQHGMLIHSLADPGSGVYVQQLICALHEDLNVSAFRRAWQRITRRHSIFRTSLSWEGPGEPLQQVHHDVALPFNIHDWRGLPQDRQDELLKNFVRLDRQHGFHLNEAPLMRLALFRLSQADYRLIWTSHHVLLDGRSRLLVLNELFAFYEAFCRGRNLHLKRPPPYRQYVDWLCRQNPADAENFWRRVLSGCTASTPLVVDRVPPVQPEAEGFGKQTVRLPERLTRALKTLARRHRLTPNTFLQGAWALLLSRYSGEEDVIFGATRAGRHSTVRGAESMVGLLINTVPVRVRVLSESPLLPWLKELRSQWIAMRDFEHAPLAKIQQWSQVPAGTPLFESLLVFESYQLNSTVQKQGEGWGGREFELLGTTNYPITVLGYLGRELFLEITHDRRRFDDASVSRMLGHLTTLLEEMVCEPARKLRDFPLLTENERRQLLSEWNNTNTRYPKNQCIHELFEMQADRTPDAVAVVFEGEQLTYGELNRRSNQVAHYLRELGVRPETLVGICVERSIEMVVGVLGILKAGGAYVPLDPTNPKERLGLVLREIQAPVMLTQQKLLGALPETIALEKSIQRIQDRQSKIQNPIGVCLDRDWEIIARQNESNPDNLTAADNLAYVMYTSGSTGKPKGVSVVHRGVVRLVKETHYVELTEKEVFLQFAPLSFDASTFEIWGSLLNGARLVIFPPYMPSLQQLGETIKQSHITTLWLTSALFQLMVDNNIESLRGIKQLIAGGEALSAPHIRKVIQELPECRMINGYGPTENTTFTCCYPVAAPEQVTHSVSVGRPIANTRAYLLDRYLNPVPVGVPGELYAGGDGLARGYHNNPDLTAEKFIPDPVGHESGARLYRTGDIARYLPDGNIEFLGRTDHQVKLRGFRIELGEIEAVLAQHPAMRQVVVLAREDVGGEKVLVAYVVPQQGHTLTANELRSFLKQKLPEYMVPSAFVFLDVLPVTPNGKVDRKALPAPSPVMPGLKDAFATPRTSIEEVLAGIWAQVLKRDEIGIYDNFFELGGHSLLATQIISRVRDTFKVDLGLESLFQAPTVLDLALKIENRRRVARGLRPQPPLVRVQRGTDVLLSFAQRGVRFLNHSAPKSSYNIHRAFRLKGPLNRAALEQALNTTVTRHETLRSTFMMVQGQAAQRIASSLRLQLPTIDLSSLPESLRAADLRTLTYEEATRPFDLAEGPLLRASLVRLSDNDHVLLFTIHHIICDGWSLSVFLRDLSAFYSAYLRDEPPGVPELPVQYGDYVQWQHQRLEGDLLQVQVNYWKKRLRGAPFGVIFPTDRPRPSVPSHRGATQHLALSEPLSESVKTLSRRESVTLFMTLLAAFNTVLGGYSGDGDIVLTSPIAYRDCAELENLIGYFNNRVVLRTDLSGGPTFRQLLWRVREVVLGAFEHQDLPFERIIEELVPNGNVSPTSLLQVSLNMLNVPDHCLELPGLAAEDLNASETRSQYDLALYIREQQNRILFRLIYNTDLFDDATIVRLLRDLQTLLEDIVKDLDQRISKLPLYTQAESRQGQLKWSETRTPARGLPDLSAVEEDYEEITL